MEFSNVPNMNSLAVYLLALLWLGIMLPSFPNNAEAVEQADNQTALVNSTGGAQLNATGGSELPMIEQLSEKGIYLVQLRWAQLQLSPEQAISIELVFLNASAPRNVTIPLVEEQSTGHENEVGSGVIETENVVPVKSYDIAIYADDGRELWKKVDQPGQGGRGTQVIVFSSNYTGPITVELTNIIPGWDTGEVSPEELADSVKFSAVVVPEFPLPAVISLATGVILSLVVIGIRHRKSFV